MKIALACYGTRGDVEPGAALARELLRRGHDVCMAVSPDQVAFIESAGLAAVAYGPDSHTALDTDFGVKVSTRLPEGNSKIKQLTGMWRANSDFIARCWRELTPTLISLVDGADILITGMLFEDGAANVAEYSRIPLVSLHFVPQRVNGRLLPHLPAPVGRAAMTVLGWLARGWFGSLEDAQRRGLGLPKVRGPAPRRISATGALEIQAYDSVCFPGLADEWAKWEEQRPFVGALTMELPTSADEEVSSWITEGTPPICFAFGSMSVQSPTDTLAMIAAACAQLGERALICSDWTDFNGVSDLDHVKVVRTMNHGVIFPLCRAVVHHGGAGTTNAALRAGVPSLILWAAPERWMWGNQLRHLQVGATRRFSSTTAELLVDDLRTILDAQFVTRARKIAERMIEPAKSVSMTADLVERYARSRRFC